MQQSFLVSVALVLVCAVPVTGAQTRSLNGARAPVGERDAVIDSDGDGLPDEWEARFGLNPSSSADADGATGDPDDDGVTNLQELQRDTHPRGTVTRYLAEGASNAFFDTSLSVFNPLTPPAAAAAHVLLRFLTSDGTRVTYPLLVPAGTRRTVRPATITGLANADFSTVIESDALVVVDRTMTWGATRYGSHTDTAVLAPSTTWYLAEGSTSGDFNLFYLLQNPTTSAVHATVRYLLPFGEPIEKTYTLPPESRTTIYVDDEGGALASTDVSAAISADAPIIVERAMYKDRPGQPFAAGHESAGVTAPALAWFLAEGATGPFFDEFVLIANPSAAAAEITAEYLLLGGGLLTKTYTIPAQGRVTIWVDDEEIPAGSGQKPLANVAVSTTVRSTNGVPVIVERAMWWPGPETTANFWYEAHNSPGATSTGTRWALAEGEVGGPLGLETYILVANTSNAAGQARVTLRFEDGTSAERTYDLAANSRTNVPVGPDFPSAVGRTFGAVVESLGNAPVPLVVERAMYSSASGDVWSAGTSALATVLTDARLGSLNRSSGPSGTLVTINGSGFSERSTIMFGAEPAAATYDATGQLRVVVPFVRVGGTVQPLPAGPVELRVDGQLVATFVVESLPPNPYAPGEVWQALIADVTSQWPGLVSQMIDTWADARPRTTSPVALAYLDALRDMTTVLTTAVPDQMTALYASLDPSAQALLERALVAQGFSPVAQAPAKAAVRVRAAEELSGDLFLEARGDWPRTASALAITGLVAEALGVVIVNPVPVVAGEIANLAGALIDAWISTRFGEVTALSLTEGGRSNEKQLDVALYGAGTTLSAGIRTRRKINMLAAATLATMASKLRQVRLAAYLVGLGQSAGVRKIIQDLIDILAKLELVGLSPTFIDQIDKLFTLDEDQQPRPISFELLDPIWQSAASTAQPVLQVAPNGTVTVVNRNRPVEEVAFHLPFHRGRVTIPESFKQVLVRVRLRSPADGTWTGIYEYGAECSHYIGIETFVLVDDGPGRVVGTVFDQVLSPSQGSASGTVTGSVQGSTITLDLAYSSGPRSRFTGTIAGDTMVGKNVGVCGLGATVTLARRQ